MSSEAEATSAYLLSNGLPYFTSEAASTGMGRRKLKKKSKAEGNE